MSELASLESVKLNLREAVEVLLDHHACAEEHARDLLERAIYGRSLQDISTFHPDGSEMPTDVTAWRKIDWASGVVEIEPSWGGSPVEHVPVVPLLNRIEFSKNFGIKTSADTHSNRTGRPPQHDWDGFWIEVCRRVYEDGRPETQRQLVNEMLNWFWDRGHDSISTRTIEKKIARLLMVLSSS